MTRSVPWISEMQRQFEWTGRLPDDGAADLAEAAAHVVAGPAWVQCMLLLGSASNLSTPEEALAYLARIAVHPKCTPSQHIQLRREAARHLLSAGFAQDARVVLTEALSAAGDYPELELSCRALATLIRVDLGQAGSGVHDVAHMLDLADRLQPRLTRRDRMWLLTDLLQVTLALCGCAGDKTFGLGCRLPRADAGCTEDVIDLLRRLTVLPDGLAHEAMPELRLLCLLGRHTACTDVGALRAERLIALAAMQGDGTTAAAAWCWMGMCCRLDGHTSTAEACCQRALAMAGNMGERRVATLSRAELVPLLAAASDYRGAFEALSALHVDERLLWSESALPLGRRWRRAEPDATHPQAASGCSAAAALHVRNACQYVDMHLANAVGTVEIAQACSISRRTLELAFRGVLGCSVKEYVRRVRVAQVRTQLQYSSAPIKRVARDLGYSCVSSMGREFKLHTGQTITEFRLNRGRP